MANKKKNVEEKNKKVNKKDLKKEKEFEKLVAEEEFEEIEDNGNHRVKGPRPISAGGSTYITDRKAEAEARKAEEERLAKRRAANAKGKKKK